MSGHPPMVCVRPHGWIAGGEAQGEPARLLAWARRAEELGFDGVFLGDRMLAHANNGGDVVYAASMIEMTTMLAAIAACTERIRVGSLIYVVPYRHPVQTAKITASLDLIADGRFVLGAGIGWNHTEFEVLGIDPSGRGSRFEEALSIIRRLWSGDPVSHHGHSWTFEDVQVTPRPVQRPGPPVWLASFSPSSALDWQEDVPQTAHEVLTRVGRVADGWVPLIYSASGKRRLDADVLAHAWRHVQTAAHRAGRSREDVDFVYSDWCYVLDGDGGTVEACRTAVAKFFRGTWEEARRTYTIGTGTEIVEQIRQHTAGIDRVNAFVLTPLDDTEEQLVALAEQVLPRLRGPDRLLENRTPYYPDR